MVGTKEFFSLFDAAAFGDGDDGTGMSKVKTSFPAVIAAEGITDS